MISNNLETYYNNEIARNIEIKHKLIEFYENFNIKKKN
jgi:hypothetical protein